MAFSAVRQMARVVFVVLAMVLASSSSAEAQTAVPISRNTTYQWIDGFGAAQPGGQHYCETSPTTLCTCPVHPPPPVSDGLPELGTCSQTAQCGTAVGSKNIVGACIIGTQDFANELYLMTPGYRNQVMDQLFSTMGGIGLTILRMKVSPTIEWTANNFTPANDVAQGVLMQQAAARGPVKLIASVWSPPGWLKSNGATIGGYCSANGAPCRLNANAEPDIYGARCPATQVCLSASVPSYLMQGFADYLSYFAKASGANGYASYFGINIYALSFTNEPDNHAVYWDTCSWTGNSIRDFLAVNLTNTFNANGITTKVIAPEASHWSFVDRETPVATEVTPPLALDSGAYLSPTYSSTLAKNRLDIAAGHLYSAPLPNGDSITQSSMQLSPMLNATTHVWQTETPGFACNSSNTCTGDSGTCICTPIGAPAMGKLMNEMLLLHNQLTQAWVSGWVWFRAYNAGASSGLIGNNAPAQDVLSNPQLFRTKMYWALGNFSRFVRPGFVRIGAPGQPVTGVYVSAYKDANLDSAGPLVIVAINSTSSSKSVLFQNVSAYATPYVTSSTWNLAAQPDVWLGSSVSLPPLSVVTYVSNPPRKSADILFRDASGRTMLWLAAVAGSANYPGESNPVQWATDWQIKGVGDFDNDGQADILWRNASGATAIWHNGTAAWITYPGAIPNEWQYAGLVDFNNNGKMDILWRYVDGTTAYWQDGNSQAVGWPGALPNYWQIQGVGDFDGNGLGDILWRQSDGTTAIWHDGSASWTTWPGWVDNGWQIQGVGEFDGNGKSDIVWRHVSGSTAIWHDGTNSGTYPGALPSDWQLQGVADYDGNGKSDFLWHNTNGNLAIWQDANAGWTTYPGNPGGTWIVQGAGKFDK
jgi:O-glycosyl hydrolase